MNSIILKEGWMLQSSEKVSEPGSVISSKDYKTAGWITAQVPSTIMGTLVNNGVYKDVFVGRNLASVPEDQFKKPWWYRTEFKPVRKTGHNFSRLEFDGINYRANIWLNGTLVAKSDTTEGAFRRFSFDVSKYVKLGEKNILAVEVFPPVPGEPTIGFVDWNPKPPDRNMGIWREVRVITSGEVSIEFPFVKSRLNLETLNEARLTITTELKNNSNHPVSGVLSADVAQRKISKKITLSAFETKLISMPADEFPELNIKNPRIWWTNDLGKPELYNLKLAFRTGNILSDENQFDFGIREISDYYTEDGHRGYKLNGKKILIRGGGWVDNMFLDNTFENYEAQIDYAKHMNLNAIRLEGFWGNSESLFDLCDQKGILIMAGWSCQWEWPASLGKETDQYGGIKSPEDMKLISKSWQDQIKWLRNHPSVYVWAYGSDMIPRPELEVKYQEVLKTDDPTRPFLASTKGWNSTVTGKTAVKMLGPYDYVPPQYWYVDKKNGGAYGFNTETGPGPQIPPLESIQRMIPKDSLWPVGNVYDYHCGGNAFNTLSRYNTMMDQRMGKSSGIEEYVKKAQFLNYEGMRAMYEAFGNNRFNNATGVIQWMYNAAWPKFWWQLYDYYLNPNGAFYGARKACEPVHIQYNYGNDEISVINNTLKEFSGLKALVRVLNFDMKEKFFKEVKLNLSPDKKEVLLMLPKQEDLSTTFFTDLRLIDTKGKVISSNFYCLSSKPDLLDSAKSNWYVTPQKEYADFSQLNSLPDVKLNISHRFTKGNKEGFVDVVLYNPSDKLAFMVDLSVHKGKDGPSVLPVFLEDNYFSLLPGEKRTVRGHFYNKDLEGKQPVLKVSGWNVKSF